MTKLCVPLGVSPASPNIYLYVLDDMGAGRWPDFWEWHELDILDLSSSGQDTALSRQQPEFKSPQVHLHDDASQLRDLGLKNSLQPV